VHGRQGQRPRAVRRGRDLDLSEVAAEEIGLTAVGTDVVEVWVLE
jgi:rare lipoprotein A (peptidoglycan hydrolase)